MLMTTTSLQTILAMAGGAGQKQQSPMMLIGWLVIMVGLFYFMMIRPQQRKEKDRKQLISNIKSGDRVIFGGGLVGIVANVKERLFVIKIADNMKVEVIKGAVTRVVQKDEDMAADSKG